MTAETKVLLIGGTSHTGKSTIADRLASELGWRQLSTDQLARHPGRPWRDDDDALPADVASYFSTRTPEALLDEVVVHYRENVWPIVEAVVRSHSNNPFDPGLVLEGSAILPERFERASWPAGVAAAWLTAPDHELRERIFEASRYETRGPEQRRFIEAFLERSLRFDRLVTGAARTRGYCCLAAGLEASMDSLRALVACDADPKS